MSLGLAGLLKRAVFHANGRRPWSWGYLAARDHVLRRALEVMAAGGRFEPAPGYGRAMDERVVEYPWFLEKLPQGTSRLLDAGSTLNYDLILDHLPLDTLRLYITTLAPEDNCYWRRGVSYVFEDVRNLSFKDGFFDCVASISSLEHVGMDNAIYTKASQFHENARKDHLKALVQFRRVLRPGGSLLVTVPYGREANLGWFQQFGRDMLGELVAGFGPAKIDIEFFRYGIDGWKRARQAECDDANYFDARVGRPVEADRAAAARAVACLCLVTEGH